MPIQSPYLLVASMDVEPGKDALFNEVYDQEHVPLLRSVPGVISIARSVKQELTMIIGGERRAIVFEHEPRYHAYYEIESPDVLTSDAWAAAVDSGRWPAQVRPFTRNRRHVLHRRLIP